MLFPLFYGVEESLDLIIVADTDAQARGSQRVFGKEAGKNMPVFEEAEEGEGGFRRGIPVAGFSWLREEKIGGGGECVPTSDLQVFQ